MHDLPHLLKIIPLILITNISNYNLVFSHYSFYLVSLTECWGCFYLSLVTGNNMRKGCKWTPILCQKCFVWILRNIKQVEMWIEKDYNKSFEWIQYGNKRKIVLLTHIDHSWNSFCGMMFSSTSLIRSFEGLSICFNLKILNWDMCCIILGISTS